MAYYWKGRLIVISIWILMLAMIAYAFGGYGK